MKVISSSEGRTQFSKLVAEAANGTPHMITRNGKQIAVMLSFDDYNELRMKDRSIDSSSFADSRRESEKST